MLDYNHRWKIGEPRLLTDRTRVDLRNKEGSTSQRLRNRLQYEYEMQVGGSTFVPYTNFELYYKTRYDTIARYKIELGATSRDLTACRPDALVRPADRHSTSAHRPQRAGPGARAALLVMPADDAAAAGPVHNNQSIGSHEPMRTMARSNHPLPGSVS